MREKPSGIVFVGWFDAAGEVFAHLACSGPSGRPERQFLPKEFGVCKIDLCVYSCSTARTSDNISYD